MSAEVAGAAEMPQNLSLGGGVRTRPNTVKRSSSASAAFTPPLAINSNPSRQRRRTCTSLTQLLAALAVKQRSHCAGTVSSDTGKKKQRPDVAGAALRHLLGRPLPPQRRPPICSFALFGRATALRPGLSRPAVTALPPPRQQF